TMVLIDRNGSILYSGEGKGRPDQEIEAYLSQSAVQAGIDSIGEDFSVRRIGGRSFVISQTSAGVSEWRVMNLVPYDEMMRDVQKMRNLVMLITAIFLITGFLLSLIIA